MRGLFDLAEMMVSVHLEEVECKVEKLITTSWRLYRRGLKKKKNPNFQMVSRPSWMSAHEVLQLRLINTVNQLLLNNNKGEELSSPEKGGLFTEKGLNRGFTVYFQKKRRRRTTTKQMA